MALVNLLYVSTESQCLKKTVLWHVNLAEQVVCEITFADVLFINVKATQVVSLIAYDA